MSKLNYLLLGATFVAGILGSSCSQKSNNDVDKVKEPIYMSSVKVVDINTSASLENAVFKGYDNVTYKDKYYSFLVPKEGGYAIPTSRDEYKPTLTSLDFTKGEPGQTIVANAKTVMQPILIEQDFTTTQGDLNGTTGGLVDLTPIEGNVTDGVLPINATVEISEGTVITDNNGNVIDELPMMASVSSKIVTMDNALSLINAEFTPSGTVFSSPLQITFNNPFGENVLEGLTLFYLGEEAWEEASIPQVKYENGQYVAQVEHFSNYSISVSPAVTTSNPEPIVKKEVVVNYKNTIKNPTHDVELLQGTKIIVSAEQALQDAGIVANDELLAVLDFQLKSQGATPDYETTTEKIELGITELPQDYCTTVTTKHIFTDTKYTYTINGKYVTVVVQNCVTTVSATNPILYDGHHHSDGTGAGGGTGGNL
ncbi:MAG: hypothetical protein ACRDDZ_02900 [Marinifilaceae bacterium]